jgi:hypothetical protein
MRRLRCHRLLGLEAQEVLDEFNGRAGELGLTDEADILSVSIFPSTAPIPIHTPKGTVNPKIEGVIVYWSDR